MAKQRIAPQSEATPEEKERRILRTMEIVYESPFRHQRMQAIQEEFGIKFRMATHYLRWALERINAQFAEKLEEKRGEALANYERWRDVAAVAGDFKTAIRAQERLDRVLGIEAAKLSQSTHTRLNVSLSDLLKEADSEQQQQEHIIDAELPALPAPEDEKQEQEKQEEATPVNEEQDELTPEEEEKLAVPLTEKEKQELDSILESLDG